MNLLTETEYELNEHGKTSDDVKWVGSSDGVYSISWDDFKMIADIDYDDGFGGQLIASDLVVVGIDWWLERHEYDGSEWWEFKKLPSQRVKTTAFDKVRGPNSLWDTLREINESS